MRVKVCHVTMKFQVADTGIVKLCEGQRGREGRQGGEGTV